MKNKYILTLILAILGASCTNIKSKPKGGNDQNILQVEKNQDPFNIDDPLEGFNRRMYYFNSRLDEYVLLPVVNTYEYVTPDFVEDRVSNFFSNIGEVKTFVNSVLQGEVSKSAITLSRFMLNSTWGIFGIFDVASEWKIPKQKEDFGLTLATYGVKNGPYLVLPVFGPSTLRDATGLVVDSVTGSYYDPLALADASSSDLEFFIPGAIDTRKNIKFEYYGTNSPFEYELVRYLFLKGRELQKYKLPYDPDTFNARSKELEELEKKTKQKLEALENE